MKSTVLKNIVPNAISLFVKNSLIINTRNINREKTHNVRIKHWHKIVLHALCSYIYTL